MIIIDFQTRIRLQQWSKELDIALKSADKVWQFILKNKMLKFMIKLSSEILPLTVFT